MSNIHEAITNVWERHENETLRKDHSHWRGAGRWKDDERWQETGRLTLGRIRAARQAMGKQHLPDPFTALEWGPGGGSNVFAMRNLCRSYYGVDISSSNLGECTRMITEEGFGSLFKPVLLSGEPSSIVSLIPEPIDVFISTAVFQHFPNKVYGADVLKAVKKVCAPGALGIVQIRYDNGNERYRPISDISEYREKHITANSYQLDEFWNLLKECGFQPATIQDINSRVNYASFVFTA